MVKNILLWSAVVFSFSTSAFELSGNRWSVGEAVIRVGIPGTGASGATFSAGLQEAMQEWTTETSFRFSAVQGFIDPCIMRGAGEFGDGVSSAGFGPTVCGNSFNGALAVARTSGTCFDFSCDTGFDITEVDIVFRDNINWDVFNGPLRFFNATSPVDFRRVALHELGHGLGLRHEEVNPAIMAPQASDTESLQLDDIAGANTIYGGQVPANFTTIQSIYGVEVRLPLNSVVGGSSSLALAGTLATSDPTVNARFIDLHQITLENDSRITASLTATDFNGFLYLTRVDATQQIIAAFTDTDSGTQGIPSIEQNVQAGTYWFGVTTDVSAARGDYTLNVAVDQTSSTRSFERFNSIYGAEVEINPNPSISGNLSAADFALDGKRLDLYQITVLANTNVRIDMTSTQFNAELIVARIFADQGLDGSFFVSNSDGGDATNARLDLTLTPGTYWIAPTSASSGETGNYSIAISVTD